MLWCVVCWQYGTRMCGLKNFSRAWIDDSSNHKTSNITANSEPHKVAMVYFCTFTCYCIYCVLILYNVYQWNVSGQHPLVAGKFRLLWNSYFHPCSSAWDIPLYPIPSIPAIHPVLIYHGTRWDDPCPMYQPPMSIPYSTLSLQSLVLTHCWDGVGHPTMSHALPPVPIVHPILMHHGWTICHLQVGVPCTNLVPEPWVVVWVTWSHWTLLHWTILADRLLFCHGGLPSLNKLE